MNPIYLIIYDETEKAQVAPLLAGVLVWLCLMGCTNGTASDAGGAQEADPKAPIVCLGDSLTAGFGASIPCEDDPAKSYPAYLQQKIRVPVINAGVSGDTSADALMRLKADVLARNPQAVIIELGANDLLGFAPLASTKSNLQAIIDALNDGRRKLYLAKFYTEPVARDLICGFVPAFNNYEAQTYLIAQYDDMFQSLASSNKIELIEDIWSGVWGDNMSDLIHPNGAGYKIMADHYFKALEPYLQKQGLLK